MIATGVYGFPKDEALSIALEEINTFLLSHEEMKVTLVVFDRKSFVLSGERFGDLQAYIDEHYVGKQTTHEYSIRRRDRHDLEALEYEERLMMSDMESEIEEDAEAPSIEMFVGSNLDDALDIEEQTFQQKLLALIDASGMKDSDFYKDAGITKQVFSTIRSNEDYQPKKETAVASALKLDLSETEDLLERAGYAFSPTSKFAVIVRYCIEHKIYKIMEVNEALFKYGQKTMKI